MRIDPFELARWRLHVLGLSTPSTDSPPAIVRRLGAVQSQDYRPGLWSVAQRRDHPSVPEVEGAFARGEIVRTHVLRPTWHFVAADDLRWLLGLTGPRVHLQNGTMYRSLELDDETLARSHDLLAEALESGTATRKEVQRAFAEGGLDAEGLRLIYILMHAELDALICSGTPRGKQQTYALVDERIPTGPMLDNESALAEMVRRYFSGHGPATVKDLRWWSSLTINQIENGLEIVGDDLDSLESDGETFWFTVPPPPSVPRSPTAWLLQTYDEYIVGYQQSRSAIDGEGRDVGIASPPGMPNARIFVDGQAVGRWRQSSRGSGLAIEVFLVRDLSKPETRALQVAVEGYGEAFQTAVELVVIR